MTPYFHFLFTTLDLAVVTGIPSANFTAFQMYQPHDENIDKLLSQWNKIQWRNNIQNRPAEKFLMVFS